jgi:hypothetical protein
MHELQPQTILDGRKEALACLNIGVGGTGSGGIVAWELMDSARTYEIEWGSAHGGNDLDHSFYYLLKKPAYRTTLLVGHSQSVLDSLIVGLSELP